MKRRTKRTEPEEEGFAEHNKLKEGKKVNMGKLQDEELELIKQYGFALLPPRIERRDKEKENRQEFVSSSYGVQCQTCGRLGMMSLEEMRNHQKKHSEKSFGQNGAVQTGGNPVSK